MLPILLAGCAPLGTPPDVVPDRSRAPDAPCEGALLVPDDHADPQAAIDAATTGDRICVGAGTWPGLLDFGGKDLELIGAEGAELTILDGDGEWGPVVTINTEAGANPLLQGFTITNGTYSYGAGVLAVGDARLQDLRITGNRADGSYDGSGGGVYAMSGRFDLRRLEVWENTADAYDTYGGGGGLTLAKAEATLEDVSIHDNVNVGDGVYSGGGGGLDVWWSTVWLSGVSVVNNENTSGWAEGGGISVDNGALYGRNVLVAGNHAGNGLGAGITVINGALGLENASVVANTSDWGEGGGGIHAIGATVTLINTDISGNVGQGAIGDGLYVDEASHASLTYTNLYGNGTLDVGGIVDPVGTDGNISVDPGYVDTSAVDPGDWDLHLAAGSALLDAGDPALIDADGSRSDIGAWGGSDAP